MKVIDAFWEERNLGKTTAEIIIDYSDDLDSISEELKKVDKQYIVCKVASGRSDVLYYLQNERYKYIEDQIEFEHDLHEVNRNRVMQRLYDSLDYRVMNQEDIDNLYEEISKGMFDSDRISLDPCFDKIISANRYKNWIRDMLDKDAIPYVFSYKGEPAGFIILITADKRTYRSVLGGGYLKFRKSGLGIVVKEMEIVKSLGGKKVTTAVSTNNANQVKALIMNGYIPSKIDHVLIKHN